jgi:hypothetical protein
MSSDEDGAELMAAFKKNAGLKATPVEPHQCPKRDGRYACAYGQF